MVGWPLALNTFEGGPGRWVFACIAHPFPQSLMRVESVSWMLKVQLKICQSKSAVCPIISTVLTRQRSCSRSKKAIRRVVDVVVGLSLCMTANDWAYPPTIQCRAIKLPSTGYQVLHWHACIEARALVMEQPVGMAITVRGPPTLGIDTLMS